MSVSDRRMTFFVGAGVSAALKRAVGNGRSCWRAEHNGSRRAARLDTQRAAERLFLLPRNCCDTLRPPPWC